MKYKILIVLTIIISFSAASEQEQYLDEKCESAHKRYERLLQKGHFFVEHNKTEGSKKYYKEAGENLEYFINKDCYQFKAQNKVLKEIKAKDLKLLEVIKSIEDIK